MSSRLGTELLRRGERGRMRVVGPAPADQLTVDLVDDPELAPELDAALPRAQAHRAEVGDRVPERAEVVVLVGNLERTPEVLVKGEDAVAPSIAAGSLDAADQREPLAVLVPDVHDV